METKNGFFKRLKSMLGMQTDEDENLYSLIEKLRARKNALKLEFDEADQNRAKELEEIIKVVDEQIKKCEKILLENNS